MIKLTAKLATFQFLINKQKSEIISSKAIVDISIVIIILISSRNACSVTIIVAENKLDTQSSSIGWSCLCFASC